MKNLVVCGQCELVNGTKIKKWSGSGFNIDFKRPGGIVLGEVRDNGDFLIKRGGENYTRITGSDFMVLCGECSNPVYIRKEDNSGTQNWDNGYVRISRQSFSGTFQYGTN